jgi:hydrogenase maturation protease
MHLVLGALPDPDNRTSLKRLVIGIGNSYRRDDGVGLAVADEIAERGLPGVRVMTAIGEPGAILDAWTGAPLAVVVDAAMREGSTPGQIRRWTPSDAAETAVVSSHALGLPQTYALGEALGQIPERLVVFTVDIAGAGHGEGLTPAVAAAVPQVVDAVLDELGR